MARVIALPSVAPAIVLAVVLAGCSSDSYVSRTLGARCDSAAECDDRCLPPGGMFPGGLCSVSCESNDSCQADASCADLEGGVCLFDCAGDPQCTFLGEGWRCIGVPMREDATRRVQVCLGG
jgi:hypothetical protein